MKVHWVGSRGHCHRSSWRARLASKVHAFRG